MLKKLVGKILNDRRGGGGSVRDDLSSNEGDEEGYSVYYSVGDGDGRDDDFKGEEDDFEGENPFDKVGKYIVSNQSNVDSQVDLKSGIRVDGSSSRSISVDDLMSFIANDLGIGDQKINIPPALQQIYLQFYEMKKMSGGQLVIELKPNIAPDKLIKFENLKFLIQGIGKIESPSWVKKIGSDDKTRRIEIEDILPFYYEQYKVQNTTHSQDSANYIMEYAIDNPKEFNAIVKNNYPKGNVPNGQQFVDSCANNIDAQKLIELVGKEYAEKYNYNANVYKIDTDAEIKCQIIDTKKMFFENKVMDEKTLPNITILHKQEGVIFELNIPKEVVEKLVKEKKLELHSPEIKQRIEGKGREK